MKEIFFAAFFSLVRLSFSIKDKFFRQKLIQKIKNLFDFFLERGLVSNVAQYESNGLEKSIDEIFELTEILLYLKIVSISPALLAQKNILRLRSELANSVLIENFKKEKEANHLPKSTKKGFNSKYKNLEMEILQ